MVGESGRPGRPSSWDVVREQPDDPSSGIAAAARGDVCRLKELWAQRPAAEPQQPSVAATHLRARGHRRWCPGTSVDRHGSTALMWAAGSGHLGACQFLLGTCRAEVDQQNKSGRTALHFSVRSDQLDVARFLVSQGARVDVTMKDGSRALDWAMFFGSLRAAEWLVDDLRCDIEATNDTMCRPVHWAAAGGHLPACKWLFDRGADFTARNAHSHGCLNKACWKGYSEVARWLLMPGPLGPGVSEQLHWLDLDGRSLAQLTDMGGHHELARELRERSESAKS